MLVSEGIISIYWFTLSCLLPLFGFEFIKGLLPYPLCLTGIVALTCTYLTISFFIIILLAGYKRKVGLCSSFLGTSFAVGILISVLTPHSYAILGWYICFLSFFHFSEYLSIAIANPDSLSLNSFMLNHSFAYGTAMVASWCEYFIEITLLPDAKNLRLISTAGFILCMFGEAIRKIAIFTASTNFHHIVQTVKNDDHQLITHGIYSWCRHPGYVGWFFWAIGTQLILVNPVCLVAYMVCSWKFFNERIVAEEITLFHFFAVDYKDYKQTVQSTGIPFIKGYNPEEHSEV